MEGDGANIDDDDTSKHKCDEFRSLLERSHELFFILRDMPRFGFRHWQTHFMKTFDVFTKLWKFQQENRTILKQLNLKRHEIGEIASKIGQLYYHYYLYTSDLKYLFEAMDFYAAILNRGYFKATDQLTDVDRRIKNLRYLARYFVVALLIKDYTLMSEIIQNLQNEVNNLPPIASTEKDDWNLVIKEGINFMNLDTDVMILDESSKVIVAQQRLLFQEEKSDNEDNLRFRNAIIIGGCEKQTKFSELTIDMFRLLQLMEYVPNDTQRKTPTLSYISSTPSKHLLYKPSFGQINAFLSAVFKDLSKNSVLLLYISGDGEKGSNESKINPFNNKNIQKYNNDNFYPEDIAPFTRNPMFIIIDTPNSEMYRSIPSLFHQPRLCLMAPTKFPDNVANRKLGGIFTLFLFEPMLGICRLCNVYKITEKTWNDCKIVLNKVGELSIQILLEEKLDLTDSFGTLLQDIFLRNIMSHFFICLFVFRLYKKSQGVSFLPMCSPMIPEHIINHKVLHRYILDMLSLIEARSLFFEYSQLPQLST